ncbi:hypothetical protein [Qipengyuania sp. ASV99]|uniref:hypothetical protein n=1 Tax=Qipengyuania sp. ASV99 TaxID=3399681 RepID=UPI003A4C7E62
MSDRLHNRWLIGSLTAALAAVMLLSAASKVTERADPDLSRSLFPLNSNALVASADRDFINGANARNQAVEKGGADLLSASTKARQSLANWPLNPRALRILALAEDWTAPEAELLLAGDALSRRDTQTQIFLIEHAARNGEIKQAMEHYDAVLRRRSGFRDPAARNLVRGMSEREIRDEVAQQLRLSPPWESLLYFHALRTPESHSGFVELHRMLAGQDVIPAEFSADFAAALAAHGRFDDAVTIAELVGESRLEVTPRLTDDDFIMEPRYPGSWATGDDGAVFLQPLNGGTALLSLSSGATGTVAYRLVALPSGKYSAALAIEPQNGSGLTAAAPPEARLACAQAGPVPTGSLDLTVTESCRFQWLSIYLPETQARPSDVLLKTITITPEG